jgi:hypothetical protein
MTIDLVIVITITTVISSISRTKSITAVTKPNISIVAEISVILFVFLGDVLMRGTKVIVT